MIKGTANSTLFLGLKFTLALSSQQYGLLVGTSVKLLKAEYQAREIYQAFLPSGSSNTFFR